MVRTLRRSLPVLAPAGAALAAPAAGAQQTAKPVLHGRHWMAITGKPLAATAGAMTFQRGGNAVDAACTMLAATSTMWDVLSWGGETQALLYNPHTGQVIGINALGRGTHRRHARVLPLARNAVSAGVRPAGGRHAGNPGGLMVMLAEYGTMSLADVLAPAIQMADGYPIEAQTANSIHDHRERIRQWPYARGVMLPHAGREREAPRAGEIVRQPDLARTLRQLVEAEAQALARGATRKEAILAA